MCQAGIRIHNARDFDQAWSGSKIQSVWLFRDLGILMGVIACLAFESMLSLMSGDRDRTIGNLEEDIAHIHGIVVGMDPPCGKSKAAGAPGSTVYIQTGATAVLQNGWQAQGADRACLLVAREVQCQALSSWVNAEGEQQGDQ